MKRRTFLLNAALTLPASAIATGPGKRPINSDHAQSKLPTTALNTADEIAVELTALKLVDSDAVKRQQEICRVQLLADPAAMRPDGKAMLNQALDNLTYAAALGGANSDPARPKVTITLAAARKALGHVVPGSRGLIDNPDTVYRFVPVDGLSKYIITVHNTTPGPAQFSFMLNDTMFSENSKKDLAHQDQPIAGLRDVDIKTDADGSFTVSVDSDPANGRPNHLQTTSDARLIWIRNSLSDWGGQHPQAIAIRRVAGPAMTRPHDEQRMATITAEILQGAINWLLALKNKTFAFSAEPNTVSKPFGRGGAWGYAARGSFNLADDEGLLVTLAPPLPGRYVGFQLNDVWQVSRPYVEASGSLNNTQALASSDGSFRYVISARDPGIHNWLDTGGIHEGGLFIRWQTLPEAKDNAVREVKLVKLSELPNLLVEDSGKVSPERRTLLNQKRAATYAHRHNV